MAWTSSHGQTTRPCQFGRLEHRCITQVCPCRAQVESNSEKANFEGS
ncbi:hypothetical protein F383_38269 [Gossypium arboreum]|uniref:Uncharacterized protein n=1 Tax=Gossypium arboreum TaxID=29729 RepID=A0A0B0MJB9_GOSAR|nr:hypothetical protein F383_38269 [Gossypium arboreum]